MDTINTSPEPSEDDNDLVIVQTGDEETVSSGDDEGRVESDTEEEPATEAADSSEPL